MKYRQSYNYGKEKEKEFRGVCERLKIHTEGGTKRQDIQDHIDGFIILWGKLWGYDFKAQKKKRRGDDDFSSEIWIELANVQGKKGWLYGKAEFIIFETKDQYLIVNREKLSEFIDKAVDKGKVLTYPCMYKLYQRRGRKDLITLIKEKDLEEYTVERIEKNDLP